MQLKKLSRSELISIYQTYGPLHFPPAELKPVSSVEFLHDSGLYSAYGYFDGSQLVAYACFVQAPELRFVLLDYYAVLEPYRNGGTGGHLLSLLADRLKDFDSIYIESENPSYAKKTSDFQLQSRRIDFYHRNGARETGLLATLFGVHYVILCLPCLEQKPSPAALPAVRQHFENLTALYSKMFPPQLNIPENVLLQEAPN